MSSSLPQFSHIDISSFPNKLEKTLAENLKAIDALLAQPGPHTWQTLMRPLENRDDELNQLWSPIGHLHAVKDSDELRTTYNACIQQLSDYGTAVSHNKKLYAAVQSLADSDNYKTLDTAQKKIIEHELRDFKLSGVTLEDNDKKQFAKLSKELAQLTTKFEENLLDATQAWHKHITDEKQLSGIPDLAKSAAKQTAEQKGLDGWVFTLNIPSYLAVVTHADDAELRKDMYYAYTTRASEQGPNAGQFDNSSVMQAILQTRFALAKLLEFSNYAERSLATKMVKDTDQVIQFLNDLLESSLPAARQEYQELREFAASELSMPDLAAWDVAYVSEKLRRKAYDISQEELRPYFPRPQVVKGLFAILEKLFQITVKDVKTDVWHPDVKCYALYDTNNELRSYVYFDLFARANKRGGAWMDECRVRRRLDSGDIQIPIAYVNCNFNPPVGNDPALLTHDDVITLFHEFGHALQHMLTKVDYADVSGINGIPWDAVEIASQFLENWAWEKESIALISKHYQTGKPLPDDLYNKMLAAKNYHAALAMVRQLEFALFDFRLHLEFDIEQDNQVQRILNEVRENVRIIPTPEFNRFQHGFSHIFAGGYAAGYYSYKWAEVMAADAFELFKEKGIFDRTTSDKFLTTFLELGGSVAPADVFKAFRGRDPQVDALLKQMGIK